MAASIEFDSQRPRNGRSETRLNCDDGISKLHAKLSKLRAEGRYCDVTICVGQEKFECHRLVLATVSEYFDVMFDNNFQESKMKEVELIDFVDAKTFAEVLNYAYSGRLPVLTESNVYFLLRTSEYLQVSEIEDDCVDYILNNLSSLTNIIEILKFAFAVNNRCLIKKLIGHICDNFAVLCTHSELFELSFNEFNTLLKEYKLPLSSCTNLRFKNEDVLLDVLIKWLMHHRDEDKKLLSYFNELSKSIDFKRISLEYRTFLSNVYKIEFNDEISLLKVLYDYLVRFSSETDSIDNDVLPISGSAPYLVPFNSELSLHAFVWYFKRTPDSKSMRVFSISERKPVWTKACTLTIYPRGKMRNIVLENEPNYFFSFSGNRRAPLNGPQFYTYSSVDFKKHSQQELRRPPCNSHSFDACNTKRRNYIYWYNSDIHRPSHYEDIEAETFSEEEICRGIYRYNCQINRWFSLPKMKRKVSNACITADENMVYLIGGKQSSHAVEADSARYVQGYDERTSAWLELPNTCRNHRNAVCCTFNGKIYITNGLVLEEYDAAARKWEIICDGYRHIEIFGSLKFDQVLRMIPYNNLLWIFTSFHNIYVVDPYEPSLKKYHKSEVLNKKINEHYNHCDSEDVRHKICYSAYYGKYHQADRFETASEIRDVIVFKDL